MCIMSFMMHSVLFWFLSLCFLMYGLVKIFHLFKDCKVHSNFLLLGCFLISSYPLLDCIAISISENQWLFLPIAGGERSVLKKGLLCSSGYTQFCYSPASPEGYHSQLEVWYCSIAQYSADGWVVRTSLVHFISERISLACPPVWL